MYVFELKQKLECVDDMRVVKCHLSQPVDPAIEKAITFLSDFEDLDLDETPLSELPKLIESIKKLQHEAGLVRISLPDEAIEKSAPLVSAEPIQGTNIFKLEF